MIDSIYGWSEPFRARIEGYCDGCDSPILKGEFIRCFDRTGSYIFCHADHSCLSMKDQKLRLDQFKDLSGLTWGQIARLFGVSERAVFLWRNGTHISQFHSDRLVSLAKELEPFLMSTPTKTRERLFTVTDGMAPYQRWLQEVRRVDNQRAWIDRQPQ